jgi:hypothetical protein
MGMTVKVLGEYVTLKVKDLAGADVVAGYLKGAVVENVADASAQHHIDSGLAEAIVDVDPEPEPVTPAFERPAGNASQEAWATYALESGQASEDEVKGLTRDELRELYG